jgi:hypothetical protein
MGDKIKKILIYAIVYGVISFLTEAVLLVLFNLKIPEDRTLIALIILLFAPIVSALIVGFRKPIAFITVVTITIVLTVIGSTQFGDETGNLKPLVIRPLAGLFAAIPASYLLSRK